MGSGIQELKHAAKLREWSTKVAECRSSGMGVKAWCKEHSIAFKTYYNWERQIVKAATQQYALPAPSRTGVLMQIEPDQLPNAETGRVNTGIVIHHGESAIILPAGSSAEAVADVVKALNRHA